MIRRLGRALRQALRDAARAEERCRLAEADAARLAGILGSHVAGTFAIEHAPREQDVLVWCGTRWEVAFWTARDDGTGRPVNGWITGWESTPRGRRALRIAEPLCWAPLPWIDRPLR